MKTQVRITSVNLNQIDVTCSEDLPGSRYLFSPKDVTVRIVFPDEAFYMDITFPMHHELDCTKKNVLSTLGQKIPCLLEFDDIIFNGI